MRLKSYALVMIIAVLACMPQVFAQEVKITFLHINDSHGIGVTPNDGDCLLARVGAIVKEVRAEGTADKVFFTNGGDIGVHTHAYDFLSDKTRGAAEILALNYLGTDIMVVGNHEFDRGVDWADHLMTISDFPWVSANVFRKETGELFTNGGAFVIKEVEGVKIAIMGLSPGLGRQWNVLTRAGNDLSALHENDVARELVPQLREKSDVVVALTHIGSRDNALAEETDVDLILGAHNHLEMPGTKLGGTLMVQAKWRHEFVARVDMTIAQKDGAWRITEMTSKLIPTADVAPDKETIDFLNDLRKKVENRQPLVPPVEMLEPVK